jgi:hypothetical protein
MNLHVRSEPARSNAFVEHDEFLTRDCAVASNDPRTAMRSPRDRHACGRAPSLVIDGKQPGPQARLAIHSWRCLWRLAAGGDIGFAESYIAGEWSSPTLGALLDLALRNFTAETRVRWLRLPRLLLKLRHALNRNTRRGSRRNIALHYDLGNEFYAHQLFRGLVFLARSDA